MTDEKDKGSDEIEFIPDAPPAGEDQAPGPPAAAKKDPEEKNAENGRHLKDKLKKKDAEIKSLKKDLDELKETHLRRLADMENLRKRFEREKSEFQQYSLSSLLGDLLVVGDNFERALKIGPSDAEGKTFREGVDLIFRMFQNLLAKNGVRPIVIEDRAFDPNFHHATIVEESAEVEEPTVAEELQKGYLLHDRLLRPTLVKVLVPKKG
jgi:molecular chaperone GrpE